MTGRIILDREGEPLRSLDATGIIITYLADVKKNPVLVEAY